MLQNVYASLVILFVIYVAFQYHLGASLPGSRNIGYGFVENPTATIVFSGFSNIFASQ